MGWKIYFWVLIILGVISYPFYGLSRLWDVVDLAIYALSILGVYGYAWKKNIGVIQFWKAYFIIFIFWNFYYHYFVPIPQKLTEIDTGGLSQGAIATINFIPFIPLFVALYLYAFKNEKLWNKSDEK